MTRKNLIYTCVVLAVAGLAVSSCSKDKAASDTAAEETLELTETTTDGDKIEMTEIKATENADGTVEIDNTLPEEVVTPDGSKNASADGYVTTPSGLKYKVVKKGSGAHPTEIGRAHV